jgi:hypothetical protein
VTAAGVRDCISISLTEQGAKSKVSPVPGTAQGRRIFSL